MLTDTACTPPLSVRGLGTCQDPRDHGCKGLSLDSVLVRWSVSVLRPAPRDPNGDAESLEARRCESSNFVPVQGCLVRSGSLAFPCEF